MSALAVLLLYCTAKHSGGRGAKHLQEKTLAVAGGEDRVWASVGNGADQERPYSSVVTSNRVEFFLKCCMSGIAEVLQPSPLWNEDRKNVGKQEAHYTAESGG